MDDETDEEAYGDFGAEPDEVFQHTELEFDNSTEICKQIDAEAYSKYFTFNRAAHHLMVDSIISSRLPSLEEINAVDPDFVARVLKNNIGKQTQSTAVKGRWRDIQERLVAHVDSNGDELLFHKDNQILRIPYKEQWVDIFKLSHIQNGQHLGWKQTLKRIHEHWCTNSRRYGIFDTFVQDSVYACPGCEFSPVVTRKKKVEFKFSERLTVSVKDLSRTMEEIAVKYKVLLRIERADRVSRNSEVKDYVCHRGRSKRGRKAAGEVNDQVKSKDRKSCRIGCPFRIRVVIPISNNDNKCTVVVREEGLAHILLSPFHAGHRPGSKDDLLCLPPHSSAIRCCEQDFSNGTANVQSLVKISASRAPLLHSQSCAAEQATYRFFLLPKDVEQLTYRLKSREPLSEDDWAALHVEAQALQAQGKVIYYQPFVPNYPDEERRPFVVVIQDAWMRENAKRFSVGSAWVISKVFSSNQFGLPLYAGLVPNQIGEELPIWFMICSSEVGTLQECVALKLTIQEVLKWLGHVRPSAIVIEKTATDFHAIQAAVDRDPFCWRDNILGGDQIACRIILCWSHVRRQWLENLLPEVSHGQKKELYEAMNSMMMAATEHGFELLLHAFNDKYKDRIGVCEYVYENWTSVSCMWRRMWPRFGRMFEHAEIDSTSFSERLWNYMKYTLLRKRSKCNVLGLLGALVPGHGSQGEILVDHYKQKQSLCDAGRFAYLECAGKSVLTGEYILGLYESDVSMLEMEDEVSLRFRIRSEVLPDVYHMVSLQNGGSCDCLHVSYPPSSSFCKHILGTRLVIEKYFPHLSAAIDEETAAAAERSRIMQSPGSLDEVLLRGADDALDLHLLGDGDSMDLCSSGSGGALRRLSMQCGELKAELRNILGVASGFNATEIALVLHSVNVLKKKLLAFNTHHLSQ